MTARQVFEATLVELSKLQAPSLKLFEFNYLFNKAINQYVNKIYSMYDVNQQTSDDLRVLKSTAYLTPTKANLNSGAIQNPGGSNNYTEEGESSWTDTDGKIWTKEVTVSNGVRTVKISCDDVLMSQTMERINPNHSGTATSAVSSSNRQIQSMHGATYEIKLPQDYLHLLNCICIFKVAKDYKCWDGGSYIEVPATRLTADSWSQIVTDLYNRPTPMKPYYYIHNVNIQNALPTGSGEIQTEYKVTTQDGAATDVSNFPRTFKLGNALQSVIQKPTASRIGNTTEVRCEIRYGKDDTVFQLAEVHVDYLKVPQHIRLTQEQMDLTEDTSQIMEFPDYVNQEIINELVHLVMERTQDPRLTTHYQMTQSIVKPTGQQTTNQN